MIDSFKLAVQDSVSRTPHKRVILDISYYALTLTESSAVGDHS